MGSAKHGATARVSQTQMFLLNFKQGIPSAYIIDRDGNVVAAGIRGSEIDTKLTERLNNQADKRA